MIQRDVILIFGKTGSGKSTLTKKIINGFDRVIVFDTVAEYQGLIIESFNDFVYYFKKQPDKFFVSCRYEDLEDYEYSARAIPVIGKCLVVMEEADNYLQSTSFSDSTDPFVRLVTRGRHSQISILAISQRPHLIAITLRAMRTKVYAFSQDEPADLDYLSAWGFDPEKLSRLELFQFETWPSVDGSF